MAYNIDTYSGTRTFRVEDGTIDSSLDIKLIGKNYAGYGEVQNENFVHLLENFAGSTAPPRPISGQLWFDTNSRRIKYYDSSSQRWKTTGGAEPSLTAPVGNALGDLWFDFQNRQLYAFDGNAYILVGPQGVSGLGTTQVKSIAVRDSSNNNRAIMVGFANSTPMFVVSSDDFTLHPDFKNPSTPDALVDFGIIKAGITLRNTDNILGLSQSNTVFWGTSSSSRFLVENNQHYKASDFILKSELSFDTEVEFKDVGFAVGDQGKSKLRVFMNDIAGIDRSPILRSDTNALTFQVNGGNLTPIIINQSTVRPALDDQIDIGTSSVRFKSIYGLQFHGSGANITDINAANISSGTISQNRLTGTYNISISGSATSATSATNAVDSQTLLVDATTYRSASTVSTANTIVCRDQNSDVNARIFNGTATTARYADLAEKYTTDYNYSVGTVITVSELTDSECTQSSEIGQVCIGVISENPAYLMNQDSSGQAVALKGRVPVRVVGKIKKGNSIMSNYNGTAIAGTTNIIGIALETNLDESEKLVECVLA